MKLYKKLLIFLFLLMFAIPASAQDIMILREGGIGDASETKAGKIEIATDVEAAAKTETNKALVPSNLPSIMAAPGTIGKLELDHNVETLAANKTLVITDKVIQKLDPDGTDRNILLPTEGTSTDLVFFVYNMGGELGEDLNIQDDAAAALETIHYGHMGICTCDGTIWTVRCLSCADAIDVLSLRVKEKNTSPLVIGQPVYTSGASGVAFPTVGLADCDDANKIEVVGLVAEAISQNTTGYTRVHGLLESVNSTKGNSINPGSEDWTAGDQLYLSATVGGLTNVKPTSGRIVKVGIALTVEGSNSKILVDIHRNPIWATAASGEDIVQRMGDSAGVNKISYRDYANNEVASFDSDGQLNFNGPRVDALYTWIEDFDDEVAAVQFESGLQADFWVTAGTNYASANVTYTAGAGGTVDAKCAAADNDSVTIFGVGNFRIDSNPIMETRFKIDNIATASCFIGFAEGSFVDKATPDDDIFVVGLDADNGHGFGATQIIALSNDNNGGADYDDMGVVMVNDTYIKVKIDLTDTEQPRVWINGTEIAAGNITGTVQAGITIAPYIMVQNLAGGAIQRALTIDYVKCWQDRG